jgi:hypothetical protein
MRRDTTASLIACAAVARIILEPSSSAPRGRVPATQNPSGSAIAPTTGERVENCYVTISAAGVVTPSLTTPFGSDTRTPSVEPSCPAHLHVSVSG